MFVLVSSPTLFVCPEPKHFYCLEKYVLFICLTSDAYTDGIMYMFLTILSIVCGTRDISGYKYANKQIIPGK